ncbi:MAG: hypothetical protein OK454_08950, partial [Thaumarchaeota archaeon]|nr:hypothetical protein [Nitrososphaerota archaeon]
AHARRSPPASLTRTLQVYAANGTGGWDLWASPLFHPLVGALDSSAPAGRSHSRAQSPERFWAHHCTTIADGLADTDADPTGR